MVQIASADRVLTLVRPKSSLSGTWETSHSGKHTMNDPLSLESLVTRDKCTPSADVGHGDPEESTYHRPTVTPSPSQAIMSLLGSFRDVSCSPSSSPLATPMILSTGKGHRSIGVPAVEVTASFLL